MLSSDLKVPCVSPIVVAPKPRLEYALTCAKQMERHVAPTIKEIIGDLNGAKVFRTLDLNQGYSQLELAPESR